jgi:hypothetical protein
VRISSVAAMRGFLWALAAVALACSGKVSTADPDATSPGGDSGGDTEWCDAGDTNVTPAGCQACVDATCSDTWNACLADTTCVDQINCISACSSASCETQCQSDHPSTKGDAVLACLRGACKSACTKTVCP